MKIDRRALRHAAAALLLACMMSPGAAAAAAGIERSPPAVATPDPSPVASAVPSADAREPASRSAVDRPSAARGGAAPQADLGIAFPAVERAPGETASALRVVIGLTLLAIVPSLLVCMTAFLRIVIVLSMLRQAIGMPETPPNTVVIGLALFLTLFTMNPVLERLNRDAVQPFLENRSGVRQSIEAAGAPLRDFMVRQTRESDLALMTDLSKAPRPESVEDVGFLQLVPAFMLSELRAAFQIGFVIFLPFLLIDLVVSSILMSLGMMMMPPITIALPVKILMFILVDGWSLIVKALVGSFH